MEVGMEIQPWQEHYKFDTAPKSDVNTRLDKGGKPTKAFWTIWYRIRALFENLNQKLADGWLILDEDGDPVKGSFVINDKELLLGVSDDKSCIVYYGWEWCEGNETLAHYKKKFAKWKMIPPKEWQRVAL